MNEEVRIALMLLCGCLHDIAEKSKEEYTPQHVISVQTKIESLLYKYPENELVVTGQ